MEMKQSLQNTAIWQELLQHYQVINKLHLVDLFSQDPRRFENFSLGVDDLFLDYSKNHLTLETKALLVRLAKEAELDKHIGHLFCGEKVNWTEQRAAWHMALRANHASEEILATLQKMRFLSEQVQQKKLVGYTGQPITDILHVGIGGSFLGPELLYQAFSQNKKLNCHFVSNFEIEVLQSLLQQLNPATTIAIFVSKSFYTQETLSNLEVILEWLTQAAGNLVEIQPQMFAVTANLAAAQTYGFLSENILPLWDWVGGRYSVWSAVSLSCVLALGFDLFEQFLQGAYAIDQHFLHTSLENNLPVLLALLGIWYNNFFSANTQAIIPYSQRLVSLPAYLQQLHMESQGKMVDKNSCPVNFPTGRIIWGDVGTRSQHSFHQLLFQGTHFVSVDFILPVNAVSGRANASQQQLIGHCLAQSQTLMQGYSYQQAYADLMTVGISDSQAKILAHYKSIRGNSPSNIILLKKLSPYALGSLLAVYEHKVYAQSIIWGINAFDQWGVERGKSMASNILEALQRADNLDKYDASTSGLIHMVKMWQ